MHETFVTFQIILQYVKLHRAIKLIVVSHVIFRDSRFLRGDWDYKTANFYSSNHLSDSDVWRQRAVYTYPGILFRPHHYYNAASNYLATHACRISEYFDKPEHHTIISLSSSIRFSEMGILQMTVLSSAEIHFEIPLS